jgi:hypothetical protein
MDAIAQWTDWPVVLKAIGLMVAGTALIVGVVVAYDRWSHRKPKQPKRAKPVKAQRPCCCGKCDTGDDLDLAEAVGVTPTVVAGSDLDRKRRPIGEVNRRFASIAKAPELRDLNATRIEEFYLAPNGEEFRGLINRRWAA